MGTAALGIAILAHGCYRQGMKTLTMKVPDGLLGWLEDEAKRARQPKSALVREILQQHRQRRHHTRSLGSCLAQISHFSNFICQHFYFAACSSAETTSIALT